MTKNVFISYSDADGATADRISADLAESGFRVLNPRDLLAGEDLLIEIKRQLQAADYILVLLSHEYLKSSWARRELHLAAVLESEGDARLVPVLVQDTAIPPLLETRIYADLRHDYEAGLAHIKNTLAKRPEIIKIPQSTRSRRWREILQVLAGLTAAAASTISLAEVAVSDYRFAATVVVVGAMTGLVAALSASRPRRPLKPINLLTKQVDRAYNRALEQSRLNPAASMEVTHD